MNIFVGNVIAITQQALWGRSLDYCNVGGGRNIVYSEVTQSWPQPMCMPPDPISICTPHHTPHDTPIPVPLYLYPYTCAPTLFNTFTPAGRLEGPQVGRHRGILHAGQVVLARADERAGTGRAAMVLQRDLATG